MSILRALLVACALMTSAAPAAIPLYRATLVAPNTATVMVRDVRWVCAGSACAAPRDASAPDTSVCTAFARKLGRLSRFTAAERVFDADQLATCNEAAR